MTVSMRTLSLLLANLLMAAGLVVVPGAGPASAATAPIAAPSGLVGVGSAEGASLAWSAVAGAEGYNVYRDDRYVTTVRATDHVDPVGPGTYRYYVTAFDAGGVNFSVRSDEIILAVKGDDGPDPEPDPAPSLAAPSRLVGVGSTEGASLAWSAAAGAEGYNVYRDDRYVTTVRATDHVDPVGPGTYRYYVTAFDAGGVNFSSRSSEITVAVARPPDNPGKPDAVVSLGDSFISGEAGRWKGNSTDIFGSRDSTDRAHRRNSLGISSYRDSRVYIDGSAGKNGCHRSDVAPIISAAIPGATPINLACSGAVADHVHARNQRNRHTQPIQTDRLVEVTRTHDVELVVLSIGGNDMGFGDIIRSCLARFIGGQNVCRDSSQRKVDSRIESVKLEVDAAIAAIRTTLEANGDRQYRFVLQSYPSVLPRGDDFRMSQFRPSRLLGGCSFYDKDATWARDSFVPQFDAALAEVAAANDVEFLSLKDAFDGKEVCAETVRQAGERDRNQPAGHEWVRFVAEQQGELEEALHPNMYGQQAMGRCLRLVWQNPGRRYHSCTNTGGGPQDMVLRSR